MSWLSSFTGIGINPFGKDKFKVYDDGLLTGGGIGGGLSNLWEDISNGAPGGGFDMGNAAALGLSAAQIANAAELGRKSDKFANYGFDVVNQNWLANAPLRDQGRTGLLNPARPNLSGLDAIRGQIPGGLPAGAQTLNGAASALGGGGLAGPPSGSPALPRPEGGLAGQGPVAPTQPRGPGFQPVVRY